MMRVWGKVTRNGSKLIIPKHTYDPYMMFTLWIPYTKARQNYIRVYWRDWKFEPKPGEHLMATGFYDLNEYNGRQYATLHVNGDHGGLLRPDGPGVDTVVCPGVYRAEAPDWHIYPQYQREGKNEEE